MVDSNLWTNRRGESGCQQDAEVLEEGSSATTTNSGLQEHQLTGSPSQDPLERPPQNPPKSPSLRLPNIPPPPFFSFDLFELVTPDSAYMRYFQNSIIDSVPSQSQPQPQPQAQAQAHQFQVQGQVTNQPSASSLPPLIPGNQVWENTPDSPISAYMRYLQNSIIDSVPSQSQPQAQAQAHQFQVQGQVTNQPSASSLPPLIPGNQVSAYMRYLQNSIIDSVPSQSQPQAQAQAHQFQVQGQVTNQPSASSLPPLIPGNQVSAYMRYLQNSNIGSGPTQTQPQPQLQAQALQFQVQGQVTSQPSESPSLRLQNSFVRPGPIGQPSASPVLSFLSSNQVWVNKAESPISVDMRYLQNSIIDSGPRQTQPQPRLQALAQDASSSSSVSSN